MARVVATLSRSKSTATTSRAPKRSVKKTLPIQTIRAKQPRQSSFGFCDFSRRDLLCIRSPVFAESEVGFALCQI
ncbi:hypothetical protein, partial [Parathermosynechococcus lividus]